MAYATTSELADYLDVNEADLPDDASRLVERAAELVDYMTFNRIDTDDADHETAARKATCAQVEWWIDNNDELGLKTMVQSYSSGGYNVSFSESGLPELSPRGKRYLNAQGLLYTGVKLT